ncbi:hypothetical protein PQO03_02635 [Lentisphaera profundi]|uniref:DUF4034 domain-containing protein n=1 Tax=Lentisphaera profundi TaxID=1658616 RepID=A0ABY7VS35_9BACT|nr:hypothetical protein [Lentisphaera profundi]WDE96857.1 hypothetical protein PQO03_02635 [Lentisphaera profundi]
MVRLSLRALIALCAAMAVYVSVLSWRGARSKAKYDSKELINISQSLKNPSSRVELKAPAIGEIADTEIAANTANFKQVLLSWVRENPTGTLAWALSLESNERKVLVFTEFLAIWMRESPQECGDWLISNQDQAFVEDGLLRAVISRGQISPYHGIKLALSLKQRSWRSYSLNGIYESWVPKRPEQAASYLEDLKVLPEYESLVLLTLATWAKQDFTKAYEWMDASKIVNKQELLEFVFVLNCESKPKYFLDWIFNDLEPEERGAYLKDLMAVAFSRHEKIILTGVRSMSNYKKDLCFGWIAVSLSNKKNAKYQEFLDKIRVKKTKEEFRLLCYRKISQQSPDQLMHELSVVELRELGSFRKSLMLSFAKKSPQKTLLWLQSPTALNLLRELIFYSQDDTVSGMTKNLQLASYFVNSFPQSLSQKPMIDGLLTSSFVEAKQVYDDYLTTLDRMLTDIIRVQISKNNAEAYLEGIEDQAFKDLYTSKLLMHPKHKLKQEDLLLFRGIQSESLRYKVLNFLAWKIKGESVPQFLSFAESHYLLNYSLVSVVLKKWGKFDQVKASEWLHKHSNASWYIAVSANFSAQLIQSSVQDFREFAERISPHKRNLYINKLTIVFSETNPELLVLLPVALNIKKYLQTSKKEK